jgi:hypothetical protein
VVTAFVNLNLLFVLFPLIFVLGGILYSLYGYRISKFLFKKDKEVYDRFEVSSPKVFGIGMIIFTAYWDSEIRYHKEKIVKDSAEIVRFSFFLLLLGLLLPVITIIVKILVR